MTHYLRPLQIGTHFMQHQIGLQFNPESIKMLFYYLTPCFTLHQMDHTNFTIENPNNKRTLSI